MKKKNTGLTGTTEAAAGARPPVGPPLCDETRTQEPISTRNGSCVRASSHNSRAEGAPAAALRDGLLSL